MKLRLLFLAALFITTQAYGQVALSFDGVDDYIDANSAGPQGSSDRTVECWFKTSNVMSAQQVLVDWGSMSPLGQRFTLNYIYNGLLRIEVGGNSFRILAIWVGENLLFFIITVLKLMFFSTFKLYYFSGSLHNNTPEFIPEFVL